MKLNAFELNINDIDGDVESLDQKVLKRFLSEIPFVIISWNNLTFIKNFINQIKKYNRKIIILDNNSQYEPLHKYFDDIQIELGTEMIQIRFYNDNYGSDIYRYIADTLPDIYILSDPDLLLNKDLPNNFVEILYNLSNKYEIYKVGFALDLNDHESFLTCNNYEHGKSIYEWELEFWKKRMNNDDYELYDAIIDTTFCLVNNNYYNNNKYSAIRIAGNFTAKHLPWYKDYLYYNIPNDEFELWKIKNKSSFILK